MPWLADLASRRRALRTAGLLSGVAAGAWLGAAEAPAKLVSTGLSPVTVSLVMVCGVFLARWSVPALLQGTSAVGADVTQAPHLVIWAILAGSLWSIANTLTVYAIRDVGLSIAFPLWNSNSLLGILWGALFFGELRGATGGQRTRVIGGTIAMCVGATLLALASTHEAAHGSAARGVIAALGAGALWGTMYIPYRKAYLTGMSPLAFVTFFTVGELACMGIIALTINGASVTATELAAARGVLFWLMLGGFIWVIGDLFQQYAAKYVGISRGIPALQHQPALGTALGDARLRRTPPRAASPCPSSSSARSSWRSAPLPSPSPPPETPSTIAGARPPSARRAAMASTSSGSARASSARPPNAAAAHLDRLDAGGNFYGSVRFPGTSRRGPGTGHGPALGGHPVYRDGRAARGCGMDAVANDALQLIERVGRRTGRPSKGSWNAPVHRDRRGTPACVPLSPRGAPRPTGPATAQSQHRPTVIDIAQFHPQLVHFVVALGVAGVILRLVSLTGKAPWTNPAADHAPPRRRRHQHGSRSSPAPRPMAPPSASPAPATRCRSTRNSASARAISSCSSPHSSSRRSPSSSASNWQRGFRVASGIGGIAAAVVLYQAGEAGGKLVYSYAGGVGLRSGDPADVQRLLVAGLYHQARAARAAGNHAEAARLIDELALQRPDDPSISFLQVESMIRDRQDAAARSSCWPPRTPTPTTSGSTSRRACSPARPSTRSASPTPPAPRSRPWPTQFPKNRFIAEAVAKHQ